MRPDIDSAARRDGHIAGVRDECHGAARSVFRNIKILLRYAADIHARSLRIADLHIAAGGFECDIAAGKDNVRVVLEARTGEDHSGAKTAGDCRRAAPTGSFHHDQISGSGNPLADSPGCGDDGRGEGDISAGIEAAAGVTEDSPGGVEIEIGKLIYRHNAGPKPDNARIDGQRTRHWRDRAGRGCGCNVIEQNIPCGKVHRAAAVVEAKNLPGVEGEGLKCGLAGQVRANLARAVEVDRGITQKRETARRSLQALERGAGEDQPRSRLNGSGIIEQDADLTAIERHGLGAQLSAGVQLCAGCGVEDNALARDTGAPGD